MVRTDAAIAAIAGSLLVGFAIASWLPGDRSPAVAAGGERDLSPAEPGAATADRLQRLEQAIAAERDARMVLEDQLYALIGEIERLDAGSPEAAAERGGQTEDAGRESRRNASGRPRTLATMLQRRQERRLNQLIDGGFSTDDAERVMRLESAAHYDAMMAAHEAERAGQGDTRLTAVDQPQALLRRELGDSDYERYLEAQGLPTAVQIAQVLEQSTGSRAGLQPGDEIVSYNGERVYRVGELRALTLQGAVGEDVVIEIDRNGVRMQLNVQRGPIGISGTGARVRGANWWGGT